MNEHCQLSSRRHGKPVSFVSSSSSSSSNKFCDRKNLEYNCFWLSAIKYIFRIFMNQNNCLSKAILPFSAILPGAGALAAPFIIATGKQPVTIGKPKPLLYEIALQELQVQADSCLMIGDRPDTDILGAQQLGIQTALVRTGRFAPGEKLPDIISAPDWDVENLMQLKKSLGLQLSSR